MKIFQVMRGGFLRGWRASLPALFMRSALLGMLWWAFTEGDFDSWWIGAVIVVIASAMSLLLVPASTGAGWRPSRCLRFLPFFLWQSLLGGVDVAIRAFDPRLRIAPGFVRYPLRLPEQVVPLFSATTSLVPGTVAAGLDGRRVLYLHMLDTTRSREQVLGNTEQRIADLFGIQLLPPLHDHEMVLAELRSR